MDPANVLREGSSSIEHKNMGRGRVRLAIFKDGQTLPLPMGVENHTENQLPQVSPGFGVG